LDQSELSTNQEAARHPAILEVVEGQSLVWANQKFLVQKCFFLQNFEQTQLSFYSAELFSFFCSEFL
jgi:hypothetical protein